LPGKFYYPLVAVHALSNYHQNSILQLLIHKIKYDFRPDVARELGAILGSSFPEPNTGSLVPVPQTGYKTHKRGYNQSEIIARGISSIWRMPIHRNLLIRTRHKYSQTKMNRLERYENLRSSLLLNNIKRAEEPVWLIDDVVTTGATLNACLEVLFNGGYNRVGIVILANA
jgi:ComF family protein